MKRNSKVITIMAVMLTLMLTSCASLDLSSVKPKDLVTVAMDTYISQFKYHDAKSRLPNLSEHEKQDLQNLKKRLLDIYPVIQAANIAIGQGLTVTEAQKTTLRLFIEEMLYGN